MINTLLNEFEVLPSFLTVEITEREHISDLQEAGRNLDKVHAMGVRCAIDDYGAGYAGLLYVTELPISELKVDKSYIAASQEFLERKSTDERRLTLVEDIIKFAHHRQLIVVAEGVETRVVWSVLMELGCDEAQGFYLHRPMPGDEVAPWLVNSQDWILEEANPA